MNRKLATLIGYIACTVISVFAGCFAFPESAELASIAFFIGLASMFTYHSLLKIEANPPQKGIVTWLGSFTGEVLDAGWRFFPGNPFIYNFIGADATKVSLTFNVKANTPDSVPLEMEVNLVYRFDPENYREFINSGGKDGVTEILKDIVHERIREWSTSEEEGPQGWKEARQAREEAIAILVKAILDETLDPVDDKLPTSALLKFYSKPQQPPYHAEETKWGAGWSKLRTIIESRSAVEQGELEKRVEARREAIKKVTKGKGLSKPSLGITIRRLGLGDIKPPADIEKSASLKPVEEMKRDAEAVQLDAVRDRIKELRDMGFSPGDARDTVQVERGKLKRELKENRVSVDPETLKVLGDIAGPIIAKFFKKDS